MAKNSPRRVVVRSRDTGLIQLSAHEYTNLNDAKRYFKGIAVVLGYFEKESYVGDGLNARFGFRISPR